MIVVDRCVCTSHTFAELLLIAKREQLSLSALAERTGAGKTCGYCVAYVRRTLSSGTTVFHQLLEKEPL